MEFQALMNGMHHHGVQTCKVELIINWLLPMSALFGDQRHLHESVDLVRLHLNNFKGISRRLEMIGSVRGCHICDDYAHHPTEVRAAIQAARQRFRQKDLLVVFQPQTCSRLAALKNEFATALSDADLVVVTEEDVVDKLPLYISKDPDRETAILTLGAGGITVVGRQLLHELQQILLKSKFMGCLPAGATHFPPKNGIA